MDYSAAIRTARMHAVCHAINGGSLEIGTAGMREVLVIVKLAGGDVKGDVLTMMPAGQTAMAVATGNAASARIMDASGMLAISGLTVGTDKSKPKPDIVLSQTNIGHGVMLSPSSLSLRHGA